MSLRVTIATIALLAGPATAGTTIYVDDDAPLGGDGLSWSTAYRHLQDALAASAAAGSAIAEVRVAQGTYRPDETDLADNGSGSRFARFELVDGVAVLGGFAGLGPNPDERDPAVFETILSGDLAENDGPRFADNEENAYQVVTASFTDETARLGGVTIRAGNADLPQSQGNGPNTGGGLFIDRGSPTVTHCRFVGNAALIVGGAVYLTGNEQPGTAPLFEDCVFVGNTCSVFGGGALHVQGRAVPTIRRCRFLGNTAPAGFGGAIELAFFQPFPGTATPRLSDCVFIGNTALVGGAISLLHDLGDGSVIERCLFAGNDAARGGAIQHDRGFGTETLITDCVFTGNTAGFGGAVSNQGGSLFVTVPTYRNCTFYGNVAENEAGGISVISDGDVAVRNCILWGNVGGSGSVAGDQIFLKDPGSGAVVEYTCWQGLAAASDGNFDADPLFSGPDGVDGIVGTEDDNLRLRPGSPCIDAGDAGGLDECALDLARRARRVDDPAIADSGIGPAPPVDLGAYERGSTNGDCNRNDVLDLCEIAGEPALDLDDNGIIDACEDLGDVNGDGGIDVDDVVTVILNWGPCPAPPATCLGDVDGNGVVDIDDVALVVLAAFG